jgi:exonuclease SbcC
MLPCRLKLRGFIGIRDGLGLDEIEIDFSNIDGDLVAIVGPNGAGKTTLLDNMHPYRIMPSRATGYSPKSFSYYDHTYGEALKELEWEYGGQTYRSIIVIRGGGKTKKQECFLQVLCLDHAGDSWQPVELPDRTVSDGKAETYDRCVEHILGSPELFFTAAFACQGRPSLSDYANADIKALMSELLGLDHILALGERAAEVAKGARAQLEAIRGRAERAARVAADKSQAEQDLARHEAGAQQLQSHKASARGAAAAASRRLAEARVAQAHIADQQRRRDTLKSQIAAVEQRRDLELANVRSAFATSRSERQSVLEHCQRDAAQVEQAIAAAQGRIGKTETLLARRDEIETAAGRLSELEQEIGGAEAQAVEAERAVAEFNDADARLRQLKAEGAALRNEHDGMQERCRLIGEVPCQGTDLQGRCKLLADANAAAASLPAKAEALEQKRKEYEDARAQVLALGAPAESLAEARRRIAALRVEQKRMSEVAAMRLALETAAASLEADRAAIATASEQRERIREREEVTRMTLANLPAAEETRLTEVRASFESEIDALQKELDALPIPDAAELGKAEQEAVEAEAEIARLDAEIAKTSASVAALRERIANLDRDAAELAGDVARAKRLEDEIAHWTLLAKALGRDGIVALCIDDAGPTLTAIANDLLTTCYGPRFTVSIETQRETTKQTLAETFDIKVFDAERDTVKSIRDTSGGERIWLNESMTRAIALYQAQASGRNYECLFSDESDGALDPDKKRQFMMMKRRVLELGKYRREFFISHTPDLQAAADGRLDMSELRASGHVVVPEAA